MTENEVSIYRFKFTNEIMIELNRFAKLHMLDDRITYKDAWIEWYDNNADILTPECKRLQLLGYVGDVKDKMYKSARYYFRHKSSEIQDPLERREYISMNREILNAMDVHILRKKHELEFTPAKGYIDFCHSNIEILKTEIQRLCSSHDIQADILATKIKKTYKNRYFQCSHIED